MLLMLGVGYRFRKIGIFPFTSTVLQRTGTFSRKTERINFSPFEGRYLLHRDEMVPVIAEVIFVSKSALLDWCYLCQAYATFVLHPIIELRIGLPVDQSSHLKRMQMRIFPPHHCLNQPV